MQISRPALQEALRTFATADHGMVIGQPGVGKSYSLGSLSDWLEERGVAHLLLQVEELGEATEEALRAQLNYEGTFAAQLSELYSTSAQGVLIFDGFDAARNAKIRARLTDHIRAAIRRAPSGWSVIVSVRTYDAAKSPTLVDLFAGVSSHSIPPYSLPHIPARHFVVPELNDEEVLDAINQLPAFVGQYGSASDGLKRLLHLPFNLWLLERVLRAAPETIALGALESEMQLLELFWNLHVVQCPDSDERTYLLTRLTERLVAARRLSARKVDIYEPRTREAWEALLSSELLTARGTHEQSLAFTHNILFDYAVAVLLIDPTPEALDAFVSEDRSRPLFLRPSLVYHFQRLWYLDPPQFWEGLWRLLPSDEAAVRLVARLIPPFVLAESCSRLEELTPLLDMLKSDPELGATGVLRVLQGLQFAKPRHQEPWLRFAVEVARTPDRRFAWELGQYLSRTLANENLGQGSPLRPLYWVAAEALFRWVWDHRELDNGSWYDSFGSIVVLPLLLEVGAADAERAAAHIRRVLSLLSEPDFEIRYFYTLAGKVEKLSDISVGLTADIYKRLFAHVETSDSPTHMGGIVLRLTSNRRQDFEMCHYSLAQHFGAFLRKSPLIAGATAFAILDRAALTESKPSRSAENLMEGQHIDTFQFLGAKRRIVHDFGLDWDVGRRDDGRKMVDAVLSYFGSPESREEPRVVLESLVASCSAAATWRQLLRLGSLAAPRYGVLLHPLVLEDSILDAHELSEPISRFLPVAYPEWSTNQRQQLEARLVQLAGNGAKQWRVRRSAWLLSILPPDLLVTQEARALLTRFADEPNLERGMITRPPTVSSRAYSQDDWLKDRGVAIEDPANVGLREIRDRLSGLVEPWHNRNPAIAEVEGLLEDIRRALDELAAPTAGDSEVYESAWTKLSAAGYLLARSQPPQDTAAYALAYSILERAASFPLSGEISEEGYTWPHWSPSPRTEAIQGISFLLRVARNARLEELYLEFADSKHPSERFLAAQHAMVFAQTCRDLFWQVVADRAERETSPVVALGALNAIGRSGAAERKRAQAAKSIVRRWLDTSSAELERHIADWLSHLAASQDDPWAWSVLDELRAGLPARHELFHHVNFYLGTLLSPTFHPRGGMDARLRARDWLAGAIRSFALEIRQYSEGVDGIPVERLRSMHEAVARVADRLYFNVRRQDHLDEDDEEQPEPLGRPQYFDLVLPVIDAILEFGGADAAGVLNPSGAHHLIELLHVLLPVNPSKVVELTAGVAISASGSGYNLDSMAASEVVRLVEEVLADHRELITIDDSRAHLLALLDTLADVGWPEALRLVWRLDEAFR